jgi:ribosome biogenesis GTPase
MTGLEELGWDPPFAEAFDVLRRDDATLVPARVVIAHAREGRVDDGAAEWRATFAGKTRRAPRADQPAVGDWVAARPPAGGDLGSIEAVLPRRTRFARRAAGAVAEEQVLAANVDAAIVVMGLDGDYNLRRLERYLALSYTCGATPVVVLSKADLVEDAPARVAEVEAIAPGVLVVAARLLDEVPAAVRAVLAPGRTAVLLGSSGVGKSTLINRLLLGEVQRTRAVRTHDQRGKHTTTHRQLFRVPGGGLIIDSPGLREVQLWQADEGVGAAFDDVEELAAGCRFRDCRHDDEPGCAVRSAVEAGALPPERLASWRKLRGELAAAAAQADPLARRQRRSADRVGSKLLRQRLKEKELK